MANINFLENEVIEFKKTTGELKEGIISIVSILNKHQGGKLYFGIKDNGEIIGQDVSSKTIREVSKAISENIEPKIYPIVNKVKLNDKDCILVEFEGDDIPYLAFGRAYMRVGDEDRQLSMKEIRKIILKDENEIGKWESKISDYTIDDIDEELLDLTGENENTQEKTYENVEEKILEFCIEAKSAKEISEFCGFKSVDRFKRNYLKPLLEKGKIRMTIPEQPKNRNQKYITNNGVK